MTNSNYNSNGCCDPYSSRTIHSYGWSKITFATCLLLGTLCQHSILLAAASDDEEEFVCNVYVAPSTIPGTGLGMYAGAKGYKAGETITKSLGDHIVAIPDVKTTHSDTGIYDQDARDMTKYFLWDQYTWSKGAFGIHFYYLAAHHVEIASPGFGAAANSFMDFVNVEEGGCDHGLLPPEDPHQEAYHVHRSKDPGAGAFTAFHSRQAWANEDIAPNAEFFVSYGNDWFLDRVWRLGTIPVEGDHEDAEWLWKIFSKEFLGKNVTFGYDPQEEVVLKDIRDGRRNYNEETEEYQTTVRKIIRETQPPAVVPDELKAIHQDLWDDLVATFFKETWDDSRIMASLPTKNNWDEYETMLTTEGGYKEVKKQKMVRSQEWLQEHGTCADSVRIGRSSLSNNQAGHGAFAKTSFADGEVIMAAPLIHIPDKAVLDTFYVSYDDDDDEEEEDEEPNMEELSFSDYNTQFMTHFTPEIGEYKTGEQLLLNYAFGHRDSTMVLSPYGPGVQLINHNQTLANVKLQWAAPHRSNHHPELLEKSVDYINDNFPMGSVLGMEIVATKPITKGEELFLDYGDEWEASWQNHIETWQPKPGSEDYVSAIDLNKLPEHLNKPLENWFGKKNEASPFPKTVRLLLNAAWVDEIREVEGDDFLTESVMYNDFEYLPVTTIFKTGTVQNPYKYIVEDIKLFDKLLPKQQEHVTKKYNEIVEAAEYDAGADTADDLDAFDNTLYTVVARRELEISDEERAEARRTGRRLPTAEVVTAKDVPRRALKFEDRSYTMDQFLDNAFREYIRIPDEIFPDAWKNLPTQKEKDAHYYKYRKFSRSRPAHVDKRPWWDILKEESQDAEDLLAESQGQQQEAPTSNEIVEREKEEDYYAEDDSQQPLEQESMSMYELLDLLEEEEEEFYDEELDLLSRFT